MRLSTPMKKVLDVNNPVIMSLVPIAQTVTAEAIGWQLGNGSADKQAAMLAWWMESVLKWTPLQSWPNQCRSIAESLSSEDCAAVWSLLDTLNEHLRAIPQERRGIPHVARFSDDEDEAVPPDPQQYFPGGMER